MALVTSLFLLCYGIYVRCSLIILTGHPLTIFITKYLYKLLTLEQILFSHWTRLLGNTSAAVKKDAEGFSVYRRTRQAYTNGLIPILRCIKISIIKPHINSFSEAKHKISTKRGTKFRRTKLRYTWKCLPRSAIVLIFLRDSPLAIFFLIARCNITKMLILMPTNT